MNAQAPIHAAPLSVRNINMSRLRNYKRASTRLRSTEHRSRFKPNVNKSFTCYNDTPLPNSPHRQRSSADRTNNSLIDMRSKTLVLDMRSKNRRRQLRSTSRINSGHPGPSEDLNHLDFTLNPRQEALLSLIEKGNAEIALEKYPEAIKIFNKVLREDPDFKDALYNRAVCYMHLNQHKLAVPDLMSVEKEDCYYDRQLYIALTMCFVAMGDYATAIRQISKGLVKYPKFVEGLTTRAKLYIQQQKYEKAIQDCYRAITLKPDEGLGYSILGDALKNINDIKSCLQAYTKAINCRDNTCLLKRSKLFFELEEYENALQDTEDFLVQEPLDAEAYYQKGQILVLLNNENDAVLSFEQCIKHDNEDKNLQASSLYNISVIKIRQKDFYGAMFTFDRIGEKRVFTKEQLILKKYADAVLNMMKRNYKGGVALLSQLIKSKAEVIKEYLGCCHAYRGFGYAAIEQHVKALRNFRAAQKYEPLDKASEYNKMIVEGIVLTGKEDYSKAIELFTKGSKMFDRNFEPHFYKAMALVLKSAGVTDKTALLNEAKASIESALGIKEGESELYYYKALINYYLGMPIDAIPDLEICIDKADDNLTKHFIARGLCYGVLKLYKEALQEFSIALQIDENCSEAYFYRGRCAYMLDDSSLAFMDFQKVILNTPDDPMVHIHAGNLLMLTGSYDDAVKAFVNANGIKETISAFYQIIKCKLLVEDIEGSAKDLDELTTKFPNERTPSVDRDGLASFQLIVKFLLESIEEKKAALGSKTISSLKKLVGQNSTGEIFTATYLSMYRGVMWLYLQNYKKAKNDFVQILESTSFDSNDRTAAEILYNLVITCMISGKYEESIDMIKELMKHCSKKLTPLFMFLNGLLYILVGKQDKANKSMQEVYKHDSVLVDTFLEQNEPVSINPYPSIAIDIPPIEVQIKNSNIVQLFPAFDLPKIRMPSMSFKIDDTILKEFQIKNVKCKPEAPWLNRVKGMIQFTEEIQEIDLDSEVVSDHESGDSDREQETPEDRGNYPVERKYKSAMELPLAFESSGESIPAVKENPKEPKVPPKKQVDHSRHLTPEEIAKKMERIWGFDDES